ncbi:MAG: NUDIX domain-containing protein [Rhodobacteraceae bacterium]|nr:NUDIX domain-containing protein [Paracoccaceae bacterium]
MSAVKSASLATQPTVGVGVVIVRGTQLVLIKRGKAPRLGEWSIPGGTQELGETVRETAVREAFEETGLTVDNLSLIDVVDAFGKHPDGSLRTQWTLVDFRADWGAGELCAGGDAADARWVELADISKFGLWDETVRVIRAAFPKE